MSPALATHPPSPVCGVLVQRVCAPRPSFKVPLCTHSREFPHRLQISDPPSLWCHDANPRRGSRLLESTSGRTVSVSCSQGSISDSSFPHDGSRLRDDSGGANAGGDSSPSQEEKQPPLWDLQARHERLKAIALRIGDPLRDIFSSAGRRLQKYLDTYAKPKSEEVPCAPKLEWDWERWQSYFTEMEQQENLASALKFQLEDAVVNEDFQEAARLKSALGAATINDPVSEVLGELKKALEEERYGQAAKLRDDAAAGLVGWWVGLAEDGNNPYGRIINISSAHGRFIAKGYTARQLAAASPGTLLFEVFIRKDQEGYHQQAVYLQRDGGTGESVSGTPKSVDVNIVDMNAVATDGKDVKAKDLAEAFGDEKETGDAALMDEGLSRILNFLKDRMPDVKLKVFRVIAPDGEDIPKIVEQLLEEVTEDSADAVRRKENEVPVEEDLQGANDKVGDKEDSIVEDQKERPIRLIVGGMLQSASEDRAPRVPTRVPARIEYQSRDSFLFHIEEATPQQMPAKELSASWKVAPLATQSSTDIQPEVAKVVWNLEKSPMKVSKDIGEFLKLAVSQVHKRRGLSKCTSFKRIKLTDTNNDPFNGLYIGAFGPYTSEVVQLRRRNGHWHREDNSSNHKESFQFFEYVEAVKLTGDLNVPAGQVTFRAKTGPGNRLPHRGVYPEELGVIARYKGQGRLAEPGFKNPQWVDGELVLLDGKGIGHTNGAVLGFVYSVPERHFLVLFNRLNLKV